MLSANTILGYAIGTCSILQPSLQCFCHNPTYSQQQDKVGDLARQSSHGREDLGIRLATDDLSLLPLGPAVKEKHADVRAQPREEGVIVEWHPRAKATSNQRLVAMYDLLRRSVVLVDDEQLEELVEKDASRADMREDW